MSMSLLLVFAVFIFLFTYVVKRKFNMQTLDAWDPASFPGSKWLCYAMPVLITLAAVLATAMVVFLTHL